MFAFRVWFGRYVLGFLEKDLADRLLLKWATLGSNYLNLPVPFRRLFFPHMMFGLWVHEQWIRYWFFWLGYYLKIDTNLHQTLSKMLRNPFCPVGVWHSYKRMFFEMTPSELSGVLCSDELKGLYRARQLRCGMAPQV